MVSHRDNQLSSANLDILTGIDAPPGRIWKSSYAGYVVSELENQTGAFSVRYAPRIRPLDTQAIGHIGDTGDHRRDRSLRAPSAECGGYDRARTRARSAYIAYIRAVRASANARTCSSLRAGRVIYYAINESRALSLSLSVCSAILAKPLAADKRYSPHRERRLSSREVVGGP